ncbi:MAG: hypothetical protein RL385_302 [Pseudomonadota bacterium]|jgi:serine/threonine protein kinase
MSGASIQGQQRSQRCDTLSEDVIALTKSSPCQKVQRFEHCGLVGDGGMGSVQHAFDRDLARDVAIKRLHPHRAGDYKSLPDVLLREARIIAQLDHPNVPPVYELLRDGVGAVTGLVMMFVPGEHLGRRLNAEGETSFCFSRLSALGRMFASICDTVAFAHRRGILHLDLKAENIIVTSEGKPYVVDWGVALRCHLDTNGDLRPVEAHPGIRGTLTNMAPEQFEPGMPRVNQRTDVYGLGGVLFHMLTDKAPFAGLEQARASLARPLRVRERDSRCCEPAVPALLEICRRALSVEQRDRQPDVATIRAEVEAVLVQMARGKPRGAA